MVKIEKMTQKSLYKQYLYRVVSFICLLLALTNCQKYEPKDIVFKKVVAEINDTEITLQEFQGILKRLIPDSDMASLSKEEQKELKKNILSQLIEEELIIDEAKKKGIKVSEREVTGEIEGIKKDYQGNAFTDTIVSRYGSMEKWKEEIRRKLLTRKMIDAAVISRVTVEDNEITAYYMEHKDEITIPERVKARIIVLATEEEANNVLKRLKKGEDFTRVAKEVSIDRNMPNAGQSIYYSRGKLPKEFEDVLFSMPIKKVSSITKTPYGYNIFRVDERTKAKNLLLHEVKNDIAEKLRKTKANESFQKWIKELKNNATIDIREELL
ncbi:MAG: peptidyl-prolyl cis-trans isomerase [Deltaproteobacteria bacterium]|nr:peptidyl-prolyl cis-trans isomerase [Deltaproteobacteria bacterium]